MLHQVDLDVLGRAFELVATSPLGGRAAIHAANALDAGFVEIVSADRDFDALPRLTRLDPADLTFA